MLHRGMLFGERGKMVDGDHWIVEIEFGLSPGCSGVESLTAEVFPGPIRPVARRAGQRLTPEEPKGLAQHPGEVVSSQGTLLMRSREFDVSQARHEGAQFGDGLLLSCLDLGPQWCVGQRFESGYQIFLQKGDRSLRHLDGRLHVRTRK